MPLFNELSKKITATTQNVVRSTKEFADTARLNSMINDEQRKISTLYEQIGKLYYDIEEHNSENEMGQLCTSITSAMKYIEELQSEINKIKGVKPCPACGAEVPSSSAFCGGCGAKTVAQTDTPINAQAEENNRQCPQCNEAVEEHLTFCTSCGSRMEDE